MAGDLKLSHKKNDCGMTVSTQEFILQKPHLNYHFMLKHIVSIVPYEIPGKRSFSLVRDGRSGSEVTKFDMGAVHYKFYVSEAVMHNRSGVHRMGPTQFVMPILDELLQAIVKYSGLGSVHHEQ